MSEQRPTGRLRAVLSDGGTELHGYGRLVVVLLRWIVLGSLVGVLAGLSSAGFLVSLEWATDTFDATPWLLYLLPIAGLVIGLAYHYGGGRAVEGNNLILDQIHEPTEWVPRRMAPMVFVGTVVTHLFGGSAGREGTAIQMSGSLTDGLSRALGLSPPASSAAAHRRARRRVRRRVRRATRRRGVRTRGPDRRSTAV